MGRISMWGTNLELLEQDQSKAEEKAQAAAEKLTETEAAVAAAVSECALLQGELDAVEEASAQEKTAAVRVRNSA